MRHRGGVPTDRTLDIEVNITYTRDIHTQTSLRYNLSGVNKLLVVTV